MLKVLVADDDLIVRDMMIQMLEAKGFLTCEAKTGQEVVDLACSNDEIDIIVLDLHMPIMNGIDAYHIIRCFDKELPIIIISGHETFQLKEFIENDIYLHILRKPFSYLHLIDLVRECLMIGDKTL